MKKKIYLMIRIAISLSLISYFIITLSDKHGGLKQAAAKIFGSFKDASLIFILLAVLLTITGLSLMSLRWKILLKPHGASPKYRQLFIYYLMAAFFNNFLPSSIGGDALRAIKSRKLTKNTATSVTVIIIERLTGMFGLLVIAFTAFLIKHLSDIFSGSSLSILIFLSALVGILLFMVILTLPRVARFILRILQRILPPRIFNFIDEAYNAVTVYYKYPLDLLKAQLISIIFQFQMVFYYYFIVNAINREVEFLDCMIKVPIIIFFLMTIPSVNGLGIRTTGFKSLMNFTTANAFAVEIIDLGLRLIFGLIGGVVFLFYKRSEDSSKEFRRQ